MRDAVSSADLTKGEQDGDEVVAGAIVEKRRRTYSRLRSGDENRAPLHIESITR